ncbi:MAG: type I DNA topoisomerase [candidate division WWE3 bacterium]|nr:type I DNA topoisomerase [candidate division WWE3 bacterium]
MPKKLVIVESPTKAKTLGKFLGEDYTVLASYGHVADLPKSKIAVDTEHDFKATYIIPEKAEKHVAELRAAAKTASEIYLATDPDREGEAIAWHIADLLNKSNKSDPSTSSGQVGRSFKRVAFHEITKSAVEEAFAHPGVVNMDLVNAQQARRILDRLVGYELSPLLWKKVIFGLSAGRVQSAAVRLVVERERERQAFKPVEYWEVFVPLAREATAKTSGFDAQLVAEIRGNQGDTGDTGVKFEIGSGKQATSIVAELELAKYQISAVTKSEKRRNPYAPFITSSLQQAAGNAYGFAAKRTMDAAQKLFEAGLITYHRTDSTNLSPQFVASVREYIGKQFGHNYLPEVAPVYATKSKNAQEAHEAIRVTDVDLSDMGDKGDKADLGKIYRLIWERSLASQMTPAVYDTVSVEVTADNKYLLRASGSVLKFDGWMTVSGKSASSFAEATDDAAMSGDTTKILANLAEGQILHLVPPIKSGQHFTEPPARYTESSLIKIMEEYGIGRPSTYAPTINTIQTRGYVGKDGRALFPKDVAFVVSDLLAANFPDVVDYAFTAHLEDELDEVAAGKIEWVPVIRDFYGPFHQLILAKDKELKKSDFVNVGKSDKKCPQCGRPLIYKLGRYGKFLSCSGWPDCKYAEFMETPEKKMAADVLVNLEQAGRLTEQLKEPCPTCGGKLVLKSGPFGEFIACEKYPKCKFLKPITHYLGLPCPKCKTGEVVIKQSKRKQTFFGCSRYPACDFVSGTDPRLPVTEAAKKPRKKAKS